MDSEAGERAESLTIMAGLLPYDLDYPVRILDIGSGHGAIAQALLDVFPHSSAIGLDMSDAMMEVGRERMSAYGDRFRYHIGDFPRARCRPNWQVPSTPSWHPSRSTTYRLTASTGCIRRSIESCPLGVAFSTWTRCGQVMIS
jgi:SAM-dependent methyltransferase